MEFADTDDRDTGLIHGELTERVIRAFYAVYNELGPGFLESVYVSALSIAFAEQEISAEREAPLVVRFRDQIVGQFRADLFVEGRLIVEVKAVSALQRVHEAQLVNYLRATRTQVGLLLNFGARPEVRRRVFQLHD